MAHHYTWLDLFAFLERWTGPEEILSRAGFDRHGAADLWDWANAQGGPFATSGAWMRYANGQPHDVVRDTLPLWVGALCLHPTPAFIVELVQYSSELGAFADHGVAEWRALLAAGKREVPSTHLSVVPRDGDWLQFVRYAGQTWLAPRGGRVERVTPPTPPRVTHTRRTPPPMRRRR
jgi:hypothetical protein